MRLTIEHTLDQFPEHPYPTELWQTKVERIYQHIYDSYWGEGRSVYQAA